MHALAPYGQAADPNSVVGFHWRGMHYTPDSPCLIGGTLYCTANDWGLWKGHTLEWIGKVKAIDLPAYQALVDNYASVVARNDGTTMARLSAIQALVSMAQLSRTIIIEKHGQTITDIKNDWGDVGSIGWPILEDVWFEVEKALEVAKENIKTHVQQRWTLWLLGGGALLWLYLGGMRR